MNQEFKSPISDSRHHNTEPYGRKKSNASNLIFIIAAIMVFLMGLGVFFFVAMSGQPDEQSIDLIEKAAIPADEE